MWVRVDPKPLDEISTDAQQELADAFIQRFCSNPFEVRPGVYVRCQTRSTVRCPSCAKLYSNDWKMILHSGVDDDANAAYRYFLLTLTAPSFGAVHHVPKSTGDGKKCRCGRLHSSEERSLHGTPVDAHKYDYVGAAAWNRDLGVLFDTTRARLRRRHPDLEYCVVREWQARLSLHVHALVRVPASDAPSALEIGELARTTWATSRIDGTVVEWGSQQTCDEFQTGQSGVRTIGYLAKAINYVVKDVLAGPANQARDHFFRFDQIARTEMRCESCLYSNPSFCRSKVHRNLGARQQVVSVSRHTKTREGWSLTGLTRKGQREVRRAWAENEADGGDAQARAAFRYEAHKWAAKVKLDARNFSS